MTSKRCLFYTCLSSSSSWESLGIFFKAVVGFEKQAYSTWSEFGICSGDTVFWYTGKHLRFSDIKLPGRLAPKGLALADCLLANLPFLYYTSMDKFSVETESTMAHWNPYKVSVLNKIRVHSYLCRSRNKNVGVMIKILVIIPTIEKDLTNCLIVKVFL